MTQKWASEWSVGLDVLDTEHSTILGLIGELSELRSEKAAEQHLGAILASVAAYTEHHFVREEQIMADVGFPGLAGHKAIHRRLKERTNDLLRQSLERPDMLDVDAVHTFLSEWWEHHILREDMAYKPFVEGRGGAQGAAVGG